MRAAGIRRYSAPVELLELPGPGELRPDEVLLEVRCDKGATSLGCRLPTNTDGGILSRGHPIARPASPS